MQRLAALAAIIPLVAGHGFVLDPPARRPGQAYKAACGEQPFYQQSADINGNVQGIFQVVGQDFDASKCNLWLCKGFLLEDNPDNLQSFSLGQKIDLSINIAAPHTGYANVSVVKTSSNSIIGEPLIEFSNYASNSGMDKNNTAFSVTLPNSLGGACTSAGECVLQWFWDAPDIDQTYEACVDFTIGGSGAGGNAGSSPSTTRPAAATAAASTQPVDAVTASETSAIASSADSNPVSSAENSAPTTTPGSGDGDEEECDGGDEGDGDEDEEPVEGDDGENGDDECPADDGSGDEGDEGDEDEDCSEDGQDDDTDQDSDATSTSIANSIPATTSSSPEPTFTGLGSNFHAGSASALKGDKTTMITSYITVSAEPRFVTVTAEPSACK